MLSNNMLRNLTTNYNKMGKLNEQLTSQKKVSRPSDDPVVAMRGLAYRTQVDKVEQYQRNLGEVNNWLDSTDDALDKVGEALKRAKELATNLSNTGAMTDGDREKIQTELKQLQQQIQDISNTKVGDKYLFSGTKTGTPLYENGKYPDDLVAFTNDVNIDVFDGVSLNVNSKNAAEMFKKIDGIFEGLTAEGATYETAISDIDGLMDDVLTERADIGARQNRAELMDNRLQSQEGIAKKQMSENEDIDIEQVITELITQESVNRAALSVGARIIQPSLVDFLR